MFSPFPLAAECNSLVRVSRRALWHHTFRLVTKQSKPFLQDIYILWLRVKATNGILEAPQPYIEAQLRRKVLHSRLINLNSSPLPFSPKEEDVSSPLLAHKIKLKRYPNHISLIENKIKLKTLSYTSISTLLRLFNILQDQ